MKRYGVWCANHPVAYGVIVAVAFTVGLLLGGLRYTIIHHQPVLVDPNDSGLLILMPPLAGIGGWAHANWMFRGLRRRD